MKTDIKTFIENHHHINYCEAIIYKDGEIDYARPSHIENLLRITGEDREVIYEKMPMTASPIRWLVDYTKCLSVWTQGYARPKEITKEQERTLNELIENNLVKDTVFF